MKTLDQTVFRWSASTLCVAGDSISLLLRRGNRDSYEFMNKIFYLVDSTSGVLLSWTATIGSAFSPGACQFGLESAFYGFYEPLPKRGPLVVLAHDIR